MEVKKTSRGFEYIEFTDRNGESCSLQASSIIGGYDDALDRPGSSAVWLGLNNAKHDCADRMHLSRERVSELIKQLRSWLKTGKFDGSLSDALGTPETYRLP